MSKLIIHNRSSVLADVDALVRVAQVIELGRVSDNGRAYGYATQFKDNSVVVATRNKSSDTFILFDGGPRNEDKID